MHKFVYTILVISLYSATTSGQNTSDKQIALDEVTVTANKIKNEDAIGAKVTQIQGADISRNLTKSLSELLTESSSIYIKSMGQGAMATASFRGTSSSHTQVLWNGISINSPQMGSFDFSQVPIYFIDQASLTHGTAAQQDGSGALGGSINFSNSFRVGSPFSATVLSEVASNETYTGAATIRTSKNNLRSSTRGFYQQSENNYRYLNKVYGSTPFYERRKNADYKQAGVMQELYYTTNKGDELKAIGWWQFDNRALPQSTIVHVTATEQSKTTNTRLLLNYDMTRSLHALSFSTAYLRGRMKYDRSMGQMADDTKKNTNNSLIGKVSYNYNGWRNIDLHALLSYRHDNVYSENYAEHKKSRNTTSLKVFSAIKATRKLHFDIQATTELTDNKLSAIYNLSGRYRILNEYLTIKASNGYNHRTPTLNDLYWNPGGNPSLKPETGFSSDLGIMSNPTWGATSLLFEATYYHMNINNWIMWIPKGNGAIWEPVNFDKVRSQGVEINGQIQTALGNTKHVIGFNYGFASSTNNSKRDDDTQGKQLPYIPRNKWNASYRFNYKDKIWFSYIASYTDKRYTSADESYQTNAYTIHNAEVGYNLQLHKNQRLSFSLRVDNLFNAYYESTQYYPMPLRMFWGRIVFSI